MAGQLTIDTLKASTGVLATQNGMSGICKAWVNFDGTANPSTIRNSFNVSSVTFNGAGDYTINFTTAMPSANYGSAGMAGYGAGVGADTMRVVSINPQTNPTTSALRINTCYANGGKDGNQFVCAAVFA